MDKSDHSLMCAVTAEWSTVQGSVCRKVAHKAATLRLMRNEFHEIFLEISSEKAAPVKVQVKAVNVHKKFMNEGKASIKFQDDKCTVFISNAPPANLMAFLKMLFIKMTNGKQTELIPSKSIRSQLLSSKPKSFEDISPLTLAEVQGAKNKISKATTTTPSPPTKKRKIDTSNSKAPVAKMLYKPPENIEEEASLNEEQRKILDACLGGRNVFFTGSAGTGKSFLLRKIISTLPPDVTVATASTGVAACHIGGTTLHSFAGIGGGDATMERSFQLAAKPVVAQKWRKCKHLIIDEISMVDGQYFEKIEQVARYIRKNDKPFGGIQLILCGDFFQLPPVITKQGKMKKRFCFQSIAWEKCVDLSFELQKVHRQKDSQFVSILNSIRIGRVTDEITGELLATAKQKIEGEGILATRLCSHTNDSKIINESKLQQLQGEERIYNAQDCSPYSTSQLDTQTVVPSKLILKIGAQVMLLKNISVSLGLVNGARGVVVRFDDGYPVVKFKNHKEFIARTEKWVVKSSSGALLSRRQIPLNLAWAFSIHKSQGLTLDCVEMSLSKIFEAGQAYVALSRAQSLQSLRVLDFDSKQVWANPTVLEFYQRFRRRLQQTEIIPLGRFMSNKNNLINEKALTEAKARMLKNFANKRTNIK